MIHLDKSNNHPTLVFLQDDSSRFTVALDAQNGDIVGIKAVYPTEPGALTRLYRELAQAVTNYQADCKRRDAQQEEVRV